MSQKVCPSCNVSNDVNATFCGSCGAPLSNAQPTPPSPPSYQPPTPPVYQAPAPPVYQAPAQANYQPPSYQQPAQGNYAQQPGYGYAPGMDADSAKAVQAAQAAGMILPAGYAPAGFWIRLGAYLIDGIIISVINWVLGLVGLPALISLLIGLGYFVYFWGAKGQTPGKMALGLYVVTIDGQPMSYGKAGLRYVGYMVSGFILGIGFLMVAFDDAKRGLHDRIASTIVVKRIG